MKVTVAVFPGSNCDQDCVHVFGRVLGQSVQTVWHRASELPPTDLLVLPGGFSYGDYLRAGAIARFAPVMAAVLRHAEAGGLVLGICNGFQILLEAGLLPGAMRMNEGRQFLCVERADTPFTNRATPGQVLRVPIAHHEGSWVAPEETLRALEDRGQILLRYCTPEGELSPEANPNGSLSLVAGLSNEAGKILGLMPHPERAAEAILESTDGLVLLESIIDHVHRRAA